MHIERTFQSLVEVMPTLDLSRDDTDIQLSGGMDSRLTGIALSRSNIQDAHFVTLNLVDGEELKIASTIADRLGFKHEGLELPEADQSDLEAAWLLTSGQTPLHAAASNLPIYRKS